MFRLMFIFVGAELLETFSGPRTYSARSSSTSWRSAILGLRSLYICLAGLLRRFVHLRAWSLRSTRDTETTPSAGSAPS